MQKTKCKEDKLSSQKGNFQFRAENETIGLFRQLLEFKRSGAQWVYDQQGIVYSFKELAELLLESSQRLWHEIAHSQALEVEEFNEQFIDNALTSAGFPQQPELRDGVRQTFVNVLRHTFETGQLTFTTREFRRMYRELTQGK